MHAINIFVHSIKHVICNKTVLLFSIIIFYVHFMSNQYFFLVNEMMHQNRSWTTDLVCKFPSPWERKLKKSRHMNSLLGRILKVVTYGVVPNALRSQETAFRVSSTTRKPQINFFIIYLLINKIQTVVNL